MPKTRFTYPTHYPNANLQYTSRQLNATYMLILSWVPRCHILYTHLHAASLHFPWWPARGVTVPAVGNRILHNRRPRRHSGSRPSNCHNGAFLIDFRVADTVLVASIRRMPLPFTNSVCMCTNRQQPFWPGSERIELSMLRNLDWPQLECAAAFSGPDTVGFRFIYCYCSIFPSISLSLAAAVPLRSVRRTPRGVMTPNKLRNVQ